MCSLPEEILTLHEAVMRWLYVCALGSTPSRLIKDEVKIINTKTNRYSKAQSTISSKCKEEKQKSLFELIDND